ncbi:nuclear transport factor 2 family protein [Lysobacter niastensis]|uniref:Nuclear transport factor 2 family protein n=1 Tax=Lysobacter niastensis TaxID=380629 RepID=A0ABS0B378_9GAMM|nr:nuclear transport factor 2 family protein [Lysobacter niastensis]MBF6022933.1 nuclear transport factor 2 family protein [Lysobacter niastensis]
MRRLLLAASLALVTVAGAPALAWSPAPQPSRPSPVADEAAQVVDSFMDALVSGRLDAARQLMSPDAVVIANGLVLGQRDSYIDGAAKGDSAALRTVQRELVRRDTHAGTDAAWVLSEKRLRSAATAQGPSEVVIETMLLARTNAGWKITHIHWSGRRG